MSSLRTLLILVGHSPLATAFQEVARHAFPDCSADVMALDIPAQSSLEDAQLEVRRILSCSQGRPVLVLVDVLGATPANAVTACLPEFPQIRIVSGLNAPMLWRTLCYRAEPLEQLAAMAVAGGQRGISVP